MNLKQILKNLYLKFRWRGKLSFQLDDLIGFGSYFEGANKIGHKTSFVGYLGYGSYIGANCHLTAKVGRFTSIAPNVWTNNAVHPYQAPFVSTSPMFYSLLKQSGKTFATEQMFEEFVWVDKDKKYAIEIGNDCWIGEGVFIAGGKRIGDGAVVYAGSFVTHDVPPYAVVAGVPAKIIKYRFEDNVIQRLLDIQWWNKPLKWIENNCDLFSDVNKFLISSIISDN